MSVLTLANFQTLFQGIALAITGLPDDQVNKSFQEQGAPWFPIANDYIFLNVSVSDNPYDKQRETVYNTSYDADDALTKVSYTRVIQVDWTLYGPNSFDLADTLRSGLLADPAREIMAASSVYPLPNIAAPVRGPMEFNTQWWERSDLTTLFNALTVRTNTVPLLAGTVIDINNGEGLSSTITLP